jgi:hypothetical protein
VFAVAGTWLVAGALDAEQLTHIADTVRQQSGFRTGYWGQDPTDTTRAHALVVLDDEAARRPRGAASRRRSVDLVAHRHARAAVAQGDRDTGTLVRREQFLRYADNGLGKAFNYLWSLGMFLVPSVALVLLGDDPGCVSFVLTAIGLAVVLVGVIIVSNAVKTPHYQVTWSAFVLFLGALCSL